MPFYTSDDGGLVGGGGVVVPPRPIASVSHGPQPAKIDLVVIIISPTCTRFDTLYAWGGVCIAVVREENDFGLGQVARPVRQSD
jgi:hypothetical protein